MQNKQAFTLIELLVVVLIIGILTAVALPQYTLAVNKTRFANLRTMATALIKASEAYYLANNEWPNNFDELALDLPGGFTASKVGTHSCGTNSKMYCCMLRDGGLTPAINCGNNEYTFAFYSMHANPSIGGGTRRYNYCVAKDNNHNAKQLCKAVTGTGGSLKGWSLLTSDGTKGGSTDYRWYSL